ncbi:caspase family protein [Variovorax sp. M-6]|uniref:caspase family protein n=1 Tax=Variovorax sp. M-6 TaxID=3233041 RepID=UPI003F9C9698
MTLVYSDPTVKIGLHAILIGVSAYKHLIDGTDEKQRNFGLKQLSAPARTVKLIGDWLQENSNRLSAPLKSLRILASASPIELTVDPDIGKLEGASLKCVQESLKAWQQDASQNADDVSLFYFAGHGIQRTRGDSLLLLDDFLGGATDLDRAIDVNNIYNGMGNFASCPNLARTQLYFIDACRSDIAELSEFERQEAAAVFRVEAGGSDERNAPIFSAAAPGKETFGRPGDRTLFGEDFLKCLNGAAGDRIAGMPVGKEWVVTMGTLYEALAKLIVSFNAVAGMQVRSLYLDKSTANTPSWTLCFLKGAPMVPCLLRVNPPAAASFASICFDPPNAKLNSIPAPLDNPFKCEKAAGFYNIEALLPNDKKPPWRDHEREVVEVRAPFFQHAINLD